MTVDEFRASIAGEEPTSATALLRALWHDARGDWDKAHRLAQDVDTADGAWVHAYLHRKEGDAGNARYWYRRANRPEVAGPLEVEWESLVEALLAGLR
ncbi:MAG: hypothetical protein AB7Q29_07960 [Vicinamibacterales bacterium]